MKCLCLQALAIVYGRCHEEIGAFTDIRYVIGMLERVRISFKELLFDSIIGVCVKFSKLNLNSDLITLLL